jgi:hypothetical protein
MLAVVVAAALAAEPASRGLTLTGVVTDKAGQALPGATVFVTTAAPRKGVGVL